MTILTAVITIIVVGFLLWLVNSFIPMEGKIKSVLNIVVVIALILWLLFGFGIISDSGEISMPDVD